MRKIFLATALGAACLTMGACNDRAADNAAVNEATDTLPADENGAAAGTDGTATTSSTTVVFPKDAKIVEDGGVTYRVNADGSRVALGATDSRIVVEGDKRYRVDPDGTRVRIDKDGLGIDLPDVDIGTSAKGNLDIDVGDKDPDGGR